VYEVETVEMPPVEMEAQVAPEEQPAISPSASETEAMADEPLPYEARPGLAGAPSPTAKKDAGKGKAQGKAGEHKDALRASADKQTRLPGLD
jgi:hypothetical protein